MSSRRRAAAVALVVALGLGLTVAFTVPGGPGSSTASAAADKKKPKPHGPKTQFPLDQFGPSDDDNAALLWSEQTLTAIRSSSLPPTAGSRVLAIAQTSVYDAW